MQPQNQPEPQEYRQIDRHIGSRIRSRRTLIGITQEHLAASLNISYQQIQKYETGANRVSASRLFEIAQQLGTEVAYFYMEFAGGTPRDLEHGGRDRIALDLVRNFKEIPSGELRAALANLVKTIRGNAGEPVSISSE